MALHSHLRYVGASQVWFVLHQVREGREYLARNPLKKAQQKEKKDEIEKALAAIVTQK